MHVRQPKTRLTRRRGHVCRSPCNGGDLRDAASCASHSCIHTCMCISYHLGLLRARVRDRVCRGGCLKIVARYKRRTGMAVARCFQAFPWASPLPSHLKATPSVLRPKILKLLHVCLFVWCKRRSRRPRRASSPAHNRLGPTKGCLYIRSLCGSCGGISRLYLQSCWGLSRGVMCDV